MKTLTIIRDKWARGGKNGASALLNGQGAMCCLGFYAKELGATEDMLRNYAPHCLVDDLSGRSRQSWIKKFKGLVRRGPSPTDLCYELMTANDKKGDEESYRESSIAQLFKKLGVNVKYV